MRELARSDPVRPQDRWTRKLDEVVWPKRRGVFGRYGWVQREFDESKHPRVPAGSPAGGQFGSGGGGEQGELWPGKFPKSRPKKKVDSVADFEKDKVHVVTTKPEKFLEAWNDAIGIEPGEFHKQFTGGLKSTMEISHRYYEHADGDVMENELQINGKILDENDRAIGTYTREIDLKNNVAESSYFALNSGAQGKGEGKQTARGQRRDVSGAWARQGQGARQHRRWRLCVGQVRLRSDRRQLGHVARRSARKARSRKRGWRRRRRLHAGRMGTQ